MEGEKGEKDICRLGKDNKRGMQTRDGRKKMKRLLKKKKEKEMGV